MAIASVVRFLLSLLILSSSTFAATIASRMFQIHPPTCHRPTSNYREPPESWINAYFVRASDALRGLQSKVDRLIEMKDFGGRGGSGSPETMRHAHNAWVSTVCTQLKHLAVLQWDGLLTLGAMWPSASPRQVYMLTAVYRAPAIPTIRRYIPKALTY